MRKKINISFHFDSNKMFEKLNEKEKDQLEESAEDRIFSQISEGYCSGELVESIGENEFYGWWYMDKYDEEPDKSFSEQYSDFEKKIRQELWDEYLNNKKDFVKSDFTYAPVIKIRNEELMFNLDNGCYLVEFKGDFNSSFIDNNGKLYSYDAITLEQRCQLLDALKNGTY